MKRRLVIIKPHVLRRSDASVVIGDIIQRFGKAGLDLIQIKMVTLSEAQARRFHLVHKERPFYQDMVERSSSGPCLAMVIRIGGEKDDQKMRELIGARDPRQAEPGSIRADYAVDIAEYAVYFSDSFTKPERDIRFFFPEMELPD